MPLRPLAKEPVKRTITSYLEIAIKISIETAKCSIFLVFYASFYSNEMVANQGIVIFL